jgi:hypothetical protein
MGGGRLGDEAADAEGAADGLGDERDARVG